MLRLRIRIERVDDKKSVDALALVGSGFIGVEPEILIPLQMVKELDLESISRPQRFTKISGDGREVELLKFRDTVRVYVAEDRVVGPIISSVLTSSGARYVLINDKLADRLGIVLIDFAEGIWCFRDELGRKMRSI